MAGTGLVINGSKKKDVLNISGGTVKTAKLGNGNDIINVSKKGKLTTLEAGAGKNKLTVSGSAVVTKAIFGAGNDTIKVTGGTVKSLDVGAGTNTLTVSGSGVVKVVKGALGNVECKDTAKLTISGGTVSSITGNGNVTVAGGTVTTLAGSGNLTVSGGTVSNFTGSGNLTITGGTVSTISGTGKVTVEGGNVSTINGTDADDVINVAQQKTVTVLASGGNNKVTVEGIDNDVFSSASTGLLNSKSGNDTITVNNGGFYRINTRDGSDKIYINGGSNVINAGETDKDGKDTIVINSTRANYVDAGAGDDTITLSGTSANNYVLGMAGNDTIIVNNAAKNLVVGGLGNDTYVINDVDSAVIINNKPGAGGIDTLKISTNQYSLLNLINSEIKYDAARDVLKCRNFYVNGFSTLTTVKDATDAEYSVSEDLMPVINNKCNDKPEKYAADFSGISDEITTIRSNWIGKDGTGNIIQPINIYDSGIATNELAIFAGYTKK
jgi:Ca2+-binding RTX toxin-like protein